jgi:uncharacterized protein involved in exopolysaccharide biosynthesis
MIAPAKPAFPLPPAVAVGRDLALAVWTRRFAAGLFFCGSVAAVLVGIMFCPRTYRSEAKLFVRLGRESVTLDPTATTGQTISVHESRENEINSVLDTLQSRVIYATVVDRIGPEAILKGSPPLDADRASAVSDEENERPDRPTGGLMTKLGLSDPMSSREKAIAALSKAVGVTAAKKSNVIAISGKASSPELAQRIVREVVAAFRAKHAEVNRTARSYDFFVAQTAELKRQYESAAEEVTTAKNALSVGTIDARRTAIQNQIALLETSLLEAGKQVAAVEASLASKRQAMGRLPETVLSQQVAGSPNSAADQGRKQLADLRLQEQTLRMRYKPTHPLVAAAAVRIERAEELLDAMGRRNLQETSVPNPARQQLELQLLSEEARAAELQAQSETLKEQLDETRQSLEKLNAHEGRLTVLENRRDVLAASYKAYAEKLEQARLDRELGREHITNVNVLQEATYVARPVVPDKRLIFLAGLVFAATGAVGLAIGLEYWPLARDALRRPVPAHPSANPSPLPSPVFDARRPALQEV